MEKLLLILVVIFGIPVAILMVILVLLGEDPDNSKVGEWIKRNEVYRPLIKKWLFIFSIIDIICSIILINIM